jgi:hypothetical protein
MNLLRTFTNLLNVLRVYFWVLPGLTDPKDDSDLERQTIVEKVVQP